MKKLLLSGVLVTMGLWSQTAANAQNPGQPGQPYSNPWSRPAFSPYLNLGRSGDPGINYFGIVRPEREFRSNYQQLQGQTSMLEQGYSSLLADPTAQIPSFTGHRSGFMTHLRYYQNNSAQPANLNRAMGGGAATAGAVGSMQNGYNRPPQRRQ